MIMERQGMAGIHNRVNSRWHAETSMFVFVILAVLFLSVDGWSACYWREGLASIGNMYESCYYGPDCNLGTGYTYCRDIRPNCGTPSRSCSNGLGYIVVRVSADTTRAGCTNTQYRSYLTCDIYCCSDQCSQDSAQHYQSCIEAGGQWVDCNCVIPSSSSQAQSSSSFEPPPSSSSESPPPSCTSKFCCDSLNQNLPVKTDTLWLGCVASDPASDKCVVYSSNVTPGDTTLNAECNGKSRYRVCTEMWMWSESAQQCGLLPTNNCIDYDVQDSMCSNVICSQTQQHELSALDYSNVTQCYTGKETVRSILICSNGLREPGTEYVRNFKVCKPFLDSLGIGIDNYISGGSGASGYGWGGQSSGGGIGGGSGGSGGGEGGSGSGGGGYGGGSGGYGGDSDGNGMGDGYQGGPGVDAQGDSVYNSPSPGLGGTWTPMPTVVTETDSNGNVTIVKNSQGGDSITTQNVFTEIRCLGVHDGIATMTNGLNTWTCQASSCSQATLSASIYGGACSGQKNGVGLGESNPSLPTINGDDGWNLTRMVGDIQKMLVSLDRFNADVNANSILDRRHADSIARAQENMWKLTFGDDLSYISTIKDGVVNFGDGLSSLQSANSQGFSAVVDAIRSAGSQHTNVTVNVDLSPVVNAVNSASSQNTSALNSVASVFRESINSASSQNTASLENFANSNRQAIASAASANRDAIYSAASDIVASNDRIRITVMSNTSSVEDVKSAVNTQGQNIVDALNSMASASSNNGGIVDTVHHTNQILESIEGAVVDTGKNIPASIWSLDSTVYDLPMRLDSMTRNTLLDWSNDKLVIMMDTNVGRVVSALESLNVDVHLDSISYIVQHDTILDSINDNLKTKGNYTLSQVDDTLNFEKYFRQGYDSVIVDTSFDDDTSFMGFFHGQQYVDGSVFDGNDNVDSVTNVVNQMLDSSQLAHNARSDSLTRAYADTMLKYSGMDTTSAALRRLFNQPNNGCPRECLDISLVYPGSNERVEVDFSRYICDMKIIGNLSVLDFIKLILRLMTSILSVMMIWSAVAPRKSNNNTWGYY